MKINSFRLGLPYFFRKRLPGMLAFGAIFKPGKPKTEQERSKSVIQDILRWADDGGKVLEIGDPLLPSNPDKSRKLAEKDDDLAGALR